MKFAITQELVQQSRQLNEERRALVAEIARVTFQASGLCFISSTTYGSEISRLDLAAICPTSLAVKRGIGLPDVKVRTSSAGILIGLGPELGKVYSHYAETLEVVLWFDLDALWAVGPSQDRDAPTWPVIFDLPIEERQPEIATRAAEAAAIARLRQPAEAAIRQLV